MTGCGFDCATRAERRLVRFCSSKSTCNLAKRKAPDEFLVGYSTMCQGAPTLPRTQNLEMSTEKRPRRRRSLGCCFSDRRTDRRLMSALGSWLTASNTFVERGTRKIFCQHLDLSPAPDRAPVAFAIVHVQNRNIFCFNKRILQYLKIGHVH